MVNLYKRKDPQYKKIHDELLEMPGQKLRNDLLGFTHSIFIFDKNYEELLRHITFLEDIRNPASWEVIAQGNKKKFTDAVKECLRLIHNFVSSSLSLIDHSRRLYKKNFIIDDENIFPDYQVMVNKVFVEDLLSSFVKDLRQYCQHYKIPSLQISTKITNIKGQQHFERMVKLTVEDLQTYSAWKARSKKFIAQNPNGVIVKDVIEKYHNKVMEFHRWFLHRQQEIYSEELHAWSVKQSEFANSKLAYELDFALEKPNHPIYSIDEIIGHFLPNNEKEEILNLNSSKDKGLRTILFFEQKVKLTPENIKNIREAFKIKEESLKK